MKKSFKPALTAVAAALTLGALTAQAQSAGQTSFTDSMASTSYLGASIGRSKYDLNGCTFSCDDRDVGFKLNAGGMFSRYLGLELGYVNLGEASRNGGDVEGQGANLSLIGRVPLSDTFSVFGKVGGIYSWTRVSTSVAGAPNGRDDGLDWSYGAGAQLDLNKTWGVRADWDRYRMNYVTGRDDADMYSLGVVYRFR